MKKGMVDKVIKTDVLSIGGGGAGITSALAAARSGSKVTIVSKGQIGNSGNTIMIGGTFAMDGNSAYRDYDYKNADPSLTKEVLFDSIVKDGFFLSDQNMVEQFVEESPAIVNEVVKWGEKSGQKFIFSKPATWLVSGKGLGRALAYGLKQTEGIDQVEDVMIVELLKDNENISGALGIDIKTGELIQFQAKAVVLGSGGFQPFSLKNTNSDMTGDGLAMAFQAGAKLSDLEFFLFLITALEPNCVSGSIFPVFLMVVGNMTNLKLKAVDKKGEEIVIPERVKALEEGSELFKLLQLFYYGKSIYKGNGTDHGGIYLDFSGNTDEQIERMFEQIEKIMSMLYQKGYYHGDQISVFKDIILKTKRLEVGLANEYSLGGILVNEKMETGVPGLYAAGECASGVFGSNRIADAVTEMLVQGYRAGLSASEYSKKNEQPKTDMEQLEKKVREILGIFDNDGLSTLEVNRKLEEIADRGLGYYRTEKSICEAISALEVLKHKVTNISIKSKSRVYNYEWIQAIQIKNRLLCSRIACEMANLRKESRGSHLRADYCKVDNDHYLHRTIAQNNNGTIEYSTRKPIITKMKDLPEGKSDYIEFIMSHDMGLDNINTDFLK